MRRFWLFIFGLVLLTLSLAPVSAQTPVVSQTGQKAGPIGDASSGKQGYILLGEFQLSGTDGADFVCDPLACVGLGPYAFLTSGNVAKVFDGNGTPFQDAVLLQIPAAPKGETGYELPAQPRLLAAAAQASEGAIRFELQALVTDSPSYTIKITFGPTITVTKDQLTKDGWVINRAYGPGHETPSPSAEASPIASPIAGDGTALGPIGASGLARVAAVVHLRGADGQQFHCFTGQNLCKGIGKYEDIYDGAAVTVTDASGKVLAQEPMTRTDESTNADLVFRAVLVVPTVEAYTFQLGRRTGFTVTRLHLMNGWTITLLLGPEPTS